LQHNKKKNATFDKNSDKNSAIAATSVYLHENHTPYTLCPSGAVNTRLKQTFSAVLNNVQRSNALCLDSYKEQRIYTLTGDLTETDV